MANRPALSTLSDLRHTHRRPGRLRVSHRQAQALLCAVGRRREREGVFGLAFTFTLIRQGRLSHCLSFTQLDSSTGILTGP